jgi:ATP-dependent Clp protease ATP-binding subunit ClpC
MKVLKIAQEQARKYGFDEITPPLLLVALFEYPEISAFFEKLDKGAHRTLRAEMGHIGSHTSPRSGMVSAAPTPNKAASDILRMAQVLSQVDQVSYEERLLSALHGCSDRDPVLEVFRQNYAEYAIHGLKLPYSRPEPAQASQASKATPALDEFGRDLTKLAREGKLDPVVGREKEIFRVAQILCRRKKNNPVLIGEPGVGKTAIAEGLAIKIANKTVSPALENQRLVSLDLTAMVAGTKYRGQFEERMKTVMAEIEAAGNIILFLDELHTVMGAGSASGSLDAANILKPALARGELRCIGATTFGEYKKSIETDGALERRFQSVTINAPGLDDVRVILDASKKYYEDHHNVAYSPEVLEAVILLCERYVTTREFPDKAVDIIDEAGALAHLQALDIPEALEVFQTAIKLATKEKLEAVEKQMYEEAGEARQRELRAKADLDQALKEWYADKDSQRVEVTEAHVRQVISNMTGIPADKMSSEEAARLKNLAITLAKRVKGQKPALAATTKAITRNLSGVRASKRPIGVFLFMGPTGVGKTETAKAIAETVFGSEEALIRLDMSEYGEKFMASKLIGAPPGYVGYEEGGILTEKVRRKPYSVVLLDEIEKAHPDVFHTFLQIFDEGRITDSLGRVVSFKHTIIIMTSNLGTKGVSPEVGFVKKEADARAQSSTDAILKRTYPPEFLNRIDEIIHFSTLDDELLHEICQTELNKLKTHLETLGVYLSFDDTVISELIAKMPTKAYGARPLKRAIETYVEDILAEFLISKDPGDAKLLLKVHEGSFQLV